MRLRRAVAHLVPSDKIEKRNGGKRPKGCNGPALNTVVNRFVSLASLLVWLGDVYGVLVCIARSDGLSNDQWGRDDDCMINAA